MSFQELLAAFRLLPTTGALCAAFAVGTTTLTAQTTVSVPCVLDNTLYESATGALSNGVGTAFFVGVTGQPGIRRGLLKFDVASLVPPGARILSAQLTLNCVQSSFAGNVDVAIHRVLQAWGEGNSSATGGGGGGAPAQSGDATWLHTFYSGSLWTTPGGDFDPVASGTIVTPPYGLCSSNVSSGLVADAQSWLNNPTQNFGWLLKTNEALPYVSRKIESRQSGAIKPTLSVAYIMPGQTATIGQGCPVNGQPFTFAINGSPIGGSSIQMVQSNGPVGQPCVNIIGLSFDPAGSPMLPQCSFYLALGGAMAVNSVVQLDGVGAASAPLSIPSGYTGVSLVMQAAALDPGSPAGYSLSNAAIALLQ
jgi:hypothetical protein